MHRISEQLAPRSKNDTASDGQPFVSIVMPIRNEARYIERCLQAVLSQDYPADRIEIIVADGMSTDETRNLVESFMQRDARITLIDNPGKFVATGLNAAIARSRGDIILRVDGHCIIDPDYTTQCVRHLLHDDVAGVGGPIDTIGETPVAEVIALAMSSPFGVGGNTFRTVQGKSMLVDTVAFPAYTRAAIQQAGLYCEELIRNQDDEYNYRLRKAGERILLADDVHSQYFSRGRLSKLAKQYFEYGYWKVRVMQKHPRQMRLRQFAPVALVVGLFLTALLGLVSSYGSWALLLLAGGYLAANLLASSLTLLRDRRGAWSLLPLVYAILHLSYGLGFAVGLVRHARRWGNDISPPQRWPEEFSACSLAARHSEGVGLESAATRRETDLDVPYFRPNIGSSEIDAVTACLRSGWLTTGQQCKAFEAEFSNRVGARHAVALNSCTAALHLAVEALGLSAGEAVLVPAHTFAATAEVIRYQGAIPVLVDVEPETLNIDLADATDKLRQIQSGELLPGRAARVVGIIVVHVGGLMIDMDAARQFATQHKLWLVEDAAHAFPAAYRQQADQPWRWAGGNTADVTCFSFYANKTITTGEGGMAVTDNDQLADRIRSMSLHGLSNDAWKRHLKGAAWDYRILAPGYKYNLTDIAASIGLAQLRRADAMREERKEISRDFQRQLENIEELELPIDPPHRIHAWHLFPIRLRSDLLAIDRNRFMEELRERGVGCSVHWRPLHLHPYYETEFGWQPQHLPVATREWTRLISLPIFPGLIAAERNHVVGTLTALCRKHRLTVGAPRTATVGGKPIASIAK